MKRSKLAYLFPGQGAQKVGMGKDFADAYPIARQTFEEADDLLKCSLSQVIFNGPESTLTRTDHSQLAILVASVAILRVISADIVPDICAGLSLGEYTALIPSGVLDFASCLELVEKRGRFMSEACDAREGSMAVIMGMSADAVESMVADLALPQDLWAANFNCPGQVVVSGTKKGIEAVKAAAAEYGAKRVLPLQVHGAFHSGLMQSAQEKLAPYIEAASVSAPKCGLVMNVSGDFAASVEQIRSGLIQQVTRPVRWEQGVRAMDREGVHTFVEIGPGKALTGMNKRIGISGKTLSIEKVEDLRFWEQEVEAWSRC